MDYNYLVPANSKKQGLIFGFLKKIDLIILATGIGVAFLLFLTIRPSTLLLGLLTMSPGLIAVFLVFPIPNYHNSRIFFREVYRYYFVNKRKYVWRGWCYKYEQSDEQSN